MEDDMLKLLGIIVGCLVLGTLPAAADACAWNQKAAADKAVKLLTKGSTILVFCPFCGDKMPRDVLSVATATSEPVPTSETHEMEVKVNGEGVDLAYVYILGGQSKKEWTNLGVAVSCFEPASMLDEMTENGMIFKILPAKFIPPAAAK
jgi:hypothetical protein